MTRSLLRKELEQHWPVLCLLAVLTMAGYGLMVFLASAQGSASAFVALRYFLMVMVVVAALVLGSRLVVVEYQNKTQLFLAGLPVSPARMITVKYLLGLFLLCLILGAAFAMSVLLGSHREIISPRFLAIVAARSLGFTWFVYNIFFMMGFLGRYRLALYLAALFAFIATVESSSFRLQELGPFLLVNDRFPFERDEFPMEALRVSFGLAGLFLVVTYVLGLAREGSVAGMLAEKMSHREKVFVATLLVGCVFGMSVLDERKQKKPFDLLEAKVAGDRGVIVKIAGANAGREEEARVLAHHVASELASVRDYLGLAEMPRVFITRRRDLDPDRYERGTLQKTEGLLVRANFGGAGWDERAFMVWLIREALIHQTSGRVKLEPKMWVLDGFGPYWMGRGNARAPLVADRMWGLRAAYGTRSGLVVNDLREWLRFREQVGEDIAAGVAWSGLRALAITRGERRLRAFLQSVLGANVPRDARALWYEWHSPIEQLFENNLGVGIPTLRGDVRFVPLSGATRKVTYRVEISPPPEPPVRYRFWYHELPVLEKEIHPQDLKKEDNVYAVAPGGELPGAFARGARFYSTFGLPVASLGCEVISGWTRREME